MPEAIEMWIRRLRDPDIATRREAIRQLEALGDTAALGPLATLFALDPDLETRKQAQWAGKSIYSAVERRARYSQVTGATEEERRKAAEILNKAQSKKNAPR
jgi:HEAT repeat protein